METSAPAPSFSFDAFLEWHFEQQIEKFGDKLTKVLLSNSIEAPAVEQPITIDEAAIFLHLGKATLYALVQKKSIPFYKRSKKIYFYRSELNKWIRDEERLKIDAGEGNFLSANKKRIKRA